MFKALSWFLYDISIWAYDFVIGLSAVAVPKASQWKKGRRSLMKDLSVIPSDQRVIWFHCASLGEFEQGRPLMESIRSAKPDHFLVLTFFSPSGYEVRKNYSGVDLVTYMPIDKKKSAQEFIDRLSPDLAIFIKYEFWFRHIQILHERKIPIVLVSAIFRSDQIFFQWYGKIFRQLLASYHRLYLQDKRSAEVLKENGFSNFLLTGDTRIDRVIKLAEDIKENKVLLEFNDRKILILGSIWESDEKVFLPFIRSAPQEWKFVIAPHEPDKYYVERYEAMFARRLVRYTRFNRYDPDRHDILLVDTVGVLAEIYQYGHLAYIGGAFGHGLHNILEPVAFQLPVAFGPKYEKFVEAVELVKRGAAFPMTEAEQFDAWIDKYTESDERVRVTHEQVLFLQDHSGSTSLIMKELEEANLI